MHPSVGEQLKAARTDKQLSLKDVAASTKIQPWILESLEHDKLQTTMNPAYARNFLISYARFLHLPHAPLAAQLFPDSGVQTMVIKPTPVFTTKPALRPAALPSSMQAAAKVAVPEPVAVAAPVEVAEPVMASAAIPAQIAEPPPAPVVARVAPAAAAPRVVAVSPMAKKAHAAAARQARVVAKRKAPAWTMPRLIMPKLPQVSIPKMSLPRLRVPKVTLPKVELPKVELPKIEFEIPWQAMRTPAGVLLGAFVMIVVLKHLPMKLSAPHQQASMAVIATPAKKPEALPKGNVATPPQKLAQTTPAVTKPASTATVKPASAVIPAPAGAKPVAPADVKPKPVAAAPAASVEAVRAPALELRIVTRKAQTIAVRVDGKLVAQRTMGAGTQDTWKASKSLELIVAKPGHVDVTLNGRSITSQVLASGGRLWITPGKIERLPES